MQAVLGIGVAFGCRWVLERAKPMQAVLCIGADCCSKELNLCRPYFA
jgi:hypothetical protein